MKGASLQRPSLPLLATLLGTVVLSACGPDFDPYYRLTSLRVLAIRSEPAAPAPGQDASFDALVFSPETGFAPDPALTYEWSWCPFPGPAEQGYPCLVTEAEVAMWSAVTGAIPSFSLGAQPIAQLPHVIDPALLGQLCRGNPAIPVLLECERGFPIQIRLKVTSANDSVDAVRTVPFRFDVTTMSPNANPAPTAFAAVVNGVEQPLADDAPPTLPRDRNTTLRVQLSEADAEPFTNPDGTASRERLTFAWFVEAGGVDERRTGPFPVDPQVAARFPDYTPLENTWNPPPVAKFMRAVARAAAVVRDDRGGVGWVTGTALLGTSP